MPFKIYTYEDPYKLDKADFWSEISALPHFCSARTLVNGLKDVLGDSIKGLICPLDELVQHEEVYMQWTDNISLRVQQYSAFSSAFKQLLEKRRISKPFHMALEQNQNHFLEAIRLFIELDISASAIDGSKGNTEQKLFVHMLKKAQESSLFRFPQTPSREKLKEIVVSLARKEVEECTGTPQEVKRCERAVGATKELPFDSIVVHGVHQFTPVQLRLLLAMEKMGITIIFLFNYQKKYSKIYSSWNDIYGCFEVPIHHDTVVREYTPPTMQNPSNALACALGEICEDRNAVGSGMLRKWYKLYKSVQLMEFANITEYAHFVSNHFDAAIQRYSESRSVMERGNDVWSNAAVLRHLDEQVYTANRDVHTLLKIYYPEYAKDRHFLSYPIGQFFSAIYRLWDYENSKIIFDVNAIKECLSSNIPYTPLSLNENYNEIGAIQNTLAYLSDNGEDDENYVTETAIPLLSALFSSPWAFEDALRRLKIDDGILLESAAAWRRQAENEHSLVNIALDEDPDLIKGRLMTAMDYIDQETDILDDESCKLVVFTAHNATLMEFLKLFNARYADMGVHAVAFGNHMEREELEDSVYAFQNDPECRVIICDETGGEGRNFQNAAQVVHLDIPWNANALEQRIGRLDRLGRNPDMDVKSVVIYADASVEEQLFHIWKDGMKLFEQSLSGLEIITGELNELIIEALLDDYYTGLNNAFDDILDQAEEMRESVEDEQDFDLGATLYRPLSQGIDNVLSIYASEDDNLFATAMMGWGKQAGLNPEKPTKTGLIEFRESSFSVNAARQSLFIPPDWKRYSNTSIMRREGKILGSFDRGTAATREDILFFAPGDAVYDSIISNAVGCNRGRCTGIETTGTYNYDGLVYIYNIAPELDELLENEMPMQTLAQYKMYLPLRQIFVAIPLNIKSKEIPEKEVVKTLLALRPNDAGHVGRRSAGRLSISPLERFISLTPPSTWEPLVDKYSASAYARARARLEKRSDLEAAEKEMQRVLNGYRAECIYFERDMSGVEERERLFDMTLRALKNAKPVLDAVCFLRVRTNGQ